ncbi:GTPase/DUF3482 domain-containing protein [Pontibacterium sp.]|uniref:GTPase/DUF3482 domain-containing protein n=1 Tax=Pontibacterium sp. TaxID=2036026 RepID=UPI00356829C9
MTPSFAVVGHPNKGKSSVVSTLARDDRVAVSMQSGTTVVAETFEIRVGESGYQLIDTPGFQRPRKVLAWLNQTNPDADKRSARVEAFLQDPQCQAQFKDEIELLRPIMAGAAILYVVDGSRPYSAEYEAEMEILRWTGQPSMALINPIENQDYVASWQQALQQYFKVVRVFNAVTADIDHHIDLLEAFAHIHQPWSAALKLLVTEFNHEIARQRLQSCQLCAQLLEDMTQYQLSQKVASKSQAESLQLLLEQRYYQWMRQREKEAHLQLQAVFRHHQLACESTELSLPDDLFDTDKWYGWGLDRKQLATVAAMAGAAAGGALDMMVAGSSFMLGAIGGGVLGSSAAWFGANSLAASKIKGIPMGGYEARQGPISNRNFPYVLLGRLLFTYRALAHRNHAQRSALQLGDIGVSQLLDALSKSEKKDLHLALDKLSRQKSVTGLADILEPLFIATLAMTTRTSTEQSE